MKSVALLLACAAGCAAFSGAEVAAAFGKWKVAYQRRYTTVEEDTMRQVPPRVARGLGVERR